MEILRFAQNDRLSFVTLSKAKDLFRCFRFGWFMMVGGWRRFCII
jgi:hypothetical protein